MSEDIRGNPNRETLRLGQPCHQDIPNQKIVNLHKSTLNKKKPNIITTSMLQVLLAPQGITFPLWDICLGHAIHYIDSPLISEKSGRRVSTEMRKHILPPYCERE